MNNSATSFQRIPFDDYLRNFKNTLKKVFYEKYDINEFSLQRGVPSLVMRDIMADAPLSTGIPSQYGGRGAHVKECLGILSAASYESLPLSLTFGINLALFLQPVAKYANEAVKPGIFQRFIEKQNMGGLMITEPDFGSDALNMETHYTESEGVYSVKGTKHWQGLSGMADYWLITARKKNEKDFLERDINFFICDVTQPDQRIIVEEYFDNLGLYMIPYGRNIIDIQVPEDYRLQPPSTGIKMMLDILHRSRMQFPGMAMGFLQRLLDEALNHCKNRSMGGKTLLDFDKVQEQISRIQGAYTICSAMCVRSTEKSGIDNTLDKDGIEANTIKSYVTDLMQEASQLFLQLSGAKGFKLSHIAGRSIVDSRPFQIFEGSNEMLYTQISEMVMKLMKVKKENNFFDFLKTFELSHKASEHFKEMLNFNLDLQLSQRKLVELGRIISRVISAEFVINMGTKGYRSDLIDECLTMLKIDVNSILSAFHFPKTTKIVDGYEEGSLWLDFA